MNNPVIYISSNTDAVDISLHTKEGVFAKTVAGYKKQNRVVAGIGDGKNDLPFLLHPQLDFIGAPANAQEEVKQLIGQRPDAYISPGTFLDGFMDFYQVCKKRGVDYIFSDRDGIFLGSNNTEDPGRIYELFLHMGEPGNPVVHILTGSSYEQNTGFIRDYRIMEALLANTTITQPYYLYAENGALQIDCRTGTYEIDPTLYNEAFLSQLKQSVFPRIIEAIDTTLLKKYGLSWSSGMQDQVEKLYIPEKHTMLTINIPKQYRDGTDYHHSTDAAALRTDLTECIRTLLEQQTLTYKIL
jgi:hypothetical protein